MEAISYALNLKMNGWGGNNALLHHAILTTYVYSAYSNALCLCIRLFYLILLELLAL